MTEDVVLYDYWRSSAAYRVRIALNVKAIAWRSVPIDLRTGAQGAAPYRAINPQGLVPALAIDGLLLTQSLAIIDYLDQTRPAPRLIPQEPAARARALARALAIAADIHPIQNLRVLNQLKQAYGASDESTAQWCRHWIATGFAALERDAPDAGLFGGAAPDIADICLVPQMGNARRFAVALDAYPRLVRIDAAARALDAFVAAAPDAVKPD